MSLGWMLSVASQERRSDSEQASGFVRAPWRASSATVHPLCQQALQGAPNSQRTYHPDTQAFWTCPSRSETEPSPRLAPAIGRPVELFAVRVRALDGDEIPLARPPDARLTDEDAQGTVLLPQVSFCSIVARTPFGPTEGVQSDTSCEFAPGCCCRGPRRVI
jgi:hypothetical protein